MSSSTSSEKGKTIKRADPSTFHNKFMVGYQGWFTCPGDGPPLDPGHHGWLHWFDYPIPDGGRPNIDLWPDVSEYFPSELFPAPGLKRANGEQVFLFSSRHPKTVQRHFHWMARHGVDGAFLQRFAGQTDIEMGNEAIRNQRDEVGDRVREAAEKEGRVFAIMYDVAGVAPDRIQRVIERDWAHLLHEKGVLDSPSYLKEKGKPVIVLWGFGFEHSNHSSETVRAIARYLRDATPGGAYLIAGLPAQWRTSTSDADRDPAFVEMWLNEFDALSPWTVGRYRDERDADNFAEERIKGDIELLKKRSEEGAKTVDYMPVVLPGGSGFNLSEGKWGFNDIKRNGGRFLWRQIFNARRLGVRTIYGAMWDEYDEGTAYMPVVSHKRLLPESEKWPFMALDEDGYSLPSDWYMRISGFAAEGLRGERNIEESFPVKELQDYWSTRPRYEDEGKDGSGSGSSSRASAYQEWPATQRNDKDEVPPPPYSLEANTAPLPPPHVPLTTRPSLSQERPTAHAQLAHGAAPTYGGQATPPVLPQSTRPQVQQIAPSVLPQSTRPQVPQIAPPVLPQSTRPQGQVPELERVPRPGSLPRPGSVHEASSVGTATSASAGTKASTTPPVLHVHSVSSITDDLHRQSLSDSSLRPSSTGPLHQQPPVHPSRPSAGRMHIPSPSPPSHIPLPAPEIVPIHSPVHGPWSQAPWPPAEWGGSHTHHQHAPPPSTYPGQPVHVCPSPPPLRPRPSLSGGPSLYPDSRLPQSSRPPMSPPRSPHHLPPPHLPQSPSMYGPPGPLFPQATPDGADSYVESSADEHHHRHHHHHHHHEQQPPWTTPTPVPFGAEVGVFPQPYMPGFEATPAPYPPTSPYCLGPAPPPPPRPPPSPKPPQNLHYPTPSNPPPLSSPSTSSGGSPLGYARNTMDRVAGQDRRKQLERGVDSLVQTGSRLFNKLTK